MEYLAESLTAYGRALALDAANEEAYRGIWDILRDSGRYDEALALYFPAKPHVTPALRLPRLARRSMWR